MQPKLVETARVVGSTWKIFPDYFGRIPIRDAVYGELLVRTNPSSRLAASDAVTEQRSDPSLHDSISASVDFRCKAVRLDGSLRSRSEAQPIGLR